MFSISDKSKHCDAYETREDAVVSSPDQQTEQVQNSAVWNYLLRAPEGHGGQPEQDALTQRSDRYL